jgi:hypothetical protein
MITNELRKGNYILLDGETICITGVKGNTVYWKDGFDMTGMTGAKIEGIPLNYNWLFRASFRKDSGNTWTRLDFGLELMSYDFKTYLGKTVKGEKITSLQFVHQLQNFFIDITGKELNL